jgi:hypothetical protein
MYVLGFENLQLALSSVALLLGLNKRYNPGPRVGVPAD